MTALSCPRCDTKLVEERRTAAATGARIDVDVCPDCAGLWLDGVEVGQAFAALGEHAMRVGDLLAAGAKRGHGIGSCPRCRAETIEFPFFEVRLDLCGACHGLWIDGDEIEAVARSTDRQDGLPAPPVERGYRERTAAALKTESTRCASCDADVPLRRTMVTSRGVVCQDCVNRAEGSDDEDPELAAYERELQGGGAAGAFGRVMGAIATALDGTLQQSRCSHCGCSRHSHCGH
jgi:Zn-finger nucleic acid-binding protein